MNRSTLLIFHFLLITFSINTPLKAQKFSQANKTVAQLSFKENKGQISDQYFKPRTDILFSGSNGSLDFYLKAGGISYQFSRVDEWTKENSLTNQKCAKNERLVPSKTTLYRLDINWLNAGTSEIKTGEALAGYENYYLASCPDGALRIKNYTHVLYKNIYPGIDLKWYQNDGALKYDYFVAPYADYSQIKLEYKGADTIYINPAGELIIHTSLGELVEQKPLVFQHGKKLEASWQVDHHQVSFQIKNADPSLALVIDPMVRLWATYYGGTGEDYISYSCTDLQSNVILSGYTDSTANIATTGAHQQVFGAGTGSDASIVKFDQLGNRLWATYYGGSNLDAGLNCKADNAGDVYLVGVTSSTNAAVFATSGAHQPTRSAALSNTWDLFLVKFNAAGIRQWGTFYGGDHGDFPGEMCVDNATNVYIAGQTNSTANIATPTSHQPAKSSSADGFLVKFNSSGVRQWGTYYGGNGNADRAHYCNTDINGNVYIAGVTNSNNNISTPGAHQPTYVSSLDGFLAKFNSSGVLTWATYYGGISDDALYSVVVDASGTIYCAGNTSSAGGTAIATPGSHQPVYGGGQDDVLLVKFDSSGQRLFGSYYGGNGAEGPGVVTLDPFGNFYISSNTSSSSGTAIATACSYQPIFGGGSADLFLAKFNPTGARLWGTYYGGPFTDYDQYCVCDAHGNIYLSGTVLANSGTIIASSNGHQPLYGGGIADGLLVKFDGCVPGSLSNLTPAGNLTVCPGNTTTLVTSCANWYANATGSVPLASGSSFTSGAISSDTTFYFEDSSCGVTSGTRSAVSITLAPAPSLSLTNSNPAACVTESVTLSASGAASYTWTGPFGSSPTSTFQVYVLLSTSYSVTGLGVNGCKSESTLLVSPNLCIGLNENTNLNHQVLVYPNPGNHMVTITSETDLDLILTNELGQILKNIHLSSSNRFTAKLEDLPEGVYFLGAEKNTLIPNKKVLILH